MKLKVLSFLVCALGLVFVSSAMAQRITISGTVTAADDGSPLPNVTVIYKGTTIGTATDIDGHYNLNAPSDTGVLVFSSIGFKTQEIPINGRTTIDVVLATTVAELNEVVVTGYGDVQKKSYTGSVASVSSNEIANIPVASVDQALQGNVAGAVVMASTGTPGAVQDIRIRGLSSINAGVSPLFVIDGVPVVSGTNASSTSTSSLGVLANLSSEDIESITILKDAVSTAPYGARGANGVVVITTKKGRPGGVIYSVSAQRGFNNRAVAGPGALNATQWDNLYYQAAGNYLDLLGYPTDRGTVDQVFGPDGWDGSTNTNWGKVVRNEDAVQQEYTLSARGGNENTTFYTSGNFFDQEGQVIGSKLNRVSGKLNISHKLDQTVTISNNFTGSYVKQDGILEGAGYFGSPVLAEFFMQPIDPAFNSDGTPNINNLSTNIFNPVYIQNNDIDRKRNYRLLNNTNVDIQIRDNFTFTTNFAIDYIFTEEKYYDNPFYGDGEDVRGDVDDINNRNFTYVWRNILKYVWTANQDNVFNFRAVSESQRNYSDYLESYGIGIAAGGLFNLNTVATPQFVGSSTTDWAVQSFTGLVNYGYKDKAFADASIRYEGNSRFSDKKRWGTFWSVGLGYLLSEENFLKDVSWLDLLKLRTSYGKTGNASIALNQYQALVGFGGYDDQPDIQPDQLGNRNLTWEKETSIDVGVEFGVFTKLNGSVTLFRKSSKDLLFDVPLSYSTGHSSQLQNSGKLYNQGIEVELNADIIRNNNFAWSLGGNFTTLKNEVTKLPTDLNGNPIEITTSTRYRAVEGYSVDAWYMKEWAGVDPENGDPLWYMDKLDSNGNPTGERTTTNNYNLADTYYQGANAQPNTYGGLNTRVDVYNFYVSANLYYAFGYKVYDGWAYYLNSDGQFNLFFGQYESQNQNTHWQEPGDVATNPKVIYGGNHNSNSNSSRFLYNGDHLRLRTLNVGYQIPAKYLENIGLKSATVYFLGQNLWTHNFDKDLKFDPEVRADGFLDLNAAPLRSVTFGIKANF